MNELKNTPTVDSGDHDFVNMAVHEIKTPVAILKGYLQLLTFKLQQDNQAGYLKTVEKIDIQVDKLLHLISDLQDGHSRDNDIYCLMNDFDLNDAIKSCYDNVKATYPQITIVYEADPSSPIVKGDKDRIEQVIHNLITNGIKYGGRQNYISIRSKVIDGHVLITVVDKGPGVPEALQEQIFQRFYRIQSENNKQQTGLGLGLYISAQIIKKHGGDIGVKNAATGGAEFWFSLPVKLKTPLSRFNEIG